MTTRRHRLLTALGEAPKGLNTRELTARTRTDGEAFEATLKRNGTELALMVDARLVMRAGRCGPIFITVAGRIDLNRRNAGEGPPKGRRFGEAVQNRVVTYRNAVECSAPRGLVNSIFNLAQRDAA
jgi:hypothetical protein